MLNRRAFSPVIDANSCIYPSAIFAAIHKIKQLLEIRYGQWRSEDEVTSQS